MFTKAEQETVIRWDREEEVAYLWTCDLKTVTKCEKAGYKLRKEHDSWWGEVPIRYITFRTQDPELAESYARARYERLSDRQKAAVEKLSRRGRE